MYKHLAVPYIKLDDGSKELQWRVDPSIELRQPEELIDEYVKELKISI